MDALTVGLAGEGSREGLGEGFGEAVFEDVAELINFFVVDVDALRSALLDGGTTPNIELGVVCLISGSREGGCILLSSILLTVKTSSSAYNQGRMTLEWSSLTSNPTGPTEILP